MNASEFVSRLEKVKQTGAEKDWVDLEGSGIYAIINYERQMAYIGSSVKISKRWREHRNDLRANRHGNPKLQNLWNKYGEKEFVFFPLEQVEDRARLLDVEQTWLDKLARKGALNIMFTACGTYGNRHTEKTKKSMSESRKGRKLPPRSLEYRAAQSIAHRGKKIGPMSPEHKAKIAASAMGNQRAKGIPWTEERKAKLRGNKNGAGNTHWIGRKHSAETRAKQSIAQKKRFAKCA